MLGSGVGSNILYLGLIIRIHITRIESFTMIVSLAGLGKLERSWNIITSPLVELYLQCHFRP